MESIVKSDAETASRPVSPMVARIGSIAPDGNGRKSVVPDHGPSPAAPSDGLTAVTPEAAEALIEAKRIGERIKFLRQRKHMGLVELGRYTGLSASFLSQLETGRVVPTLRNLARIAMVFSRDLRYFFEPERPELFRVIRAHERERLPQTGADHPGYFYEALEPVPAEHLVTPYLAEFVGGPSSTTATPHQHSGAEFLYVLSGRLRLTHEGRAEVIEEGDAIYFDPSVKHSYECLGDEPCTALILTMPEAALKSNRGTKAR